MMDTLFEGFFHWNGIMFEFLAIWFLKIVAFTVVLGFDVILVSLAVSVVIWIYSGLEEIYTYWRQKKDYERNR